MVPEDGVMLLFGGMNLLKDASASQRRACVHELRAHQVGAADHRRRSGRAVHPPRRHTQGPGAGAFATAKPFPNNPDTYEFGSKLFFECRPAEPYLKAAG